MSKQPFRSGHRCLTLTLLPVGAVKRADLDYLSLALADQGIDVTIAAEQPVPSAAFDSRRQQYLAKAFIPTARDQSGERVLAVTNNDLYTDALNFVFGLAESFGRCAVISLFRLRIGVNEEGFRRRMVKEAIHEIGHTLGLSHCVRWSCVMFFSNALSDTDRKKASFCEPCENKLQNAVDILPSSDNAEVNYGYDSPKRRSPR